MFEQLYKLKLKVGWQMIKSTYTIVGFILDHLPCIIIIARQQNLDEIRVGEEAILIRIEKFDELGTVTDVGRISSISNELFNSSRVDTLLSTSVNASER